MTDLPHGELLTARQLRAAWKPTKEALVNEGRAEGLRIRVHRACGAIGQAESLEAVGEASSNDAVVGLCVAVPVVGLTGGRLIGRPEEVLRAHESHVCAELLVLGDCCLGAHQRESTRMLFLVTAHAGLGKHEGKAGYLQLSSDISYEGGEVGLVLVIERLVDTIVPSLVPPESDDLIALARVAIHELTDVRQDAIDLVEELRVEGAGFTL